MSIIKWIIGFLAGLSALIFVILILKSEHALVTHPKGLIAHRELDLITTNVFFMLIAIVPTFFLVLLVAWKFRADNPKAPYEPEATPGMFLQSMLWILPSIIIAVMAVITWIETHKLDPYQPLDSDIKPLTIQVVAMDWKWLFIYPEQNIATLNFVQFPERTPINFKLAADGSPMNSFWIPELSGQIYSMTGMITPLHIMADGPGVYSGKAAEINGDGYASMTFVAKSTVQADFEAWVEQVKDTPLKLTNQVYEELLKPSKNHQATLYSHVEKDLFEKIVMKYMSPHTH